MATSPAHDAHARSEAAGVRVHESSMDLRAHERTFHGFIRVMTWSAVLSIAVLIFLALTNV